MIANASMQPSDFTELTPERQARLLERYERIIELSRHLNSVLELPLLLQLIIEAARELTDSEASSILLVDRRTGDLYFEAATGEESEELMRASCECSRRRRLRIGEISSSTSSVQCVWARVKPV